VLSILAFIFGASIGSFVQVIASRLHVAPIMKGRSKCLSCGEALRVSDLVPVLSYLLLRGKCRYCKSKYGPSALVVEIVFGITFLLLYQLVFVGQPTLLLSLLWLTYYTALFVVLGVMALYDRIHSYIPLSFLATFLALCALMFGKRLLADPSITTLLSPIFVALPFFLIWLVSKGKGLGFGDVILFFGVGAFFGSLQGFAVLMISVWMGALYGLYFKYIVSRKKTGVTPIPFVPFIVIGFLIVLFTGIDVFIL
jgi:prepilin signal peptidase PulO-like enzyme (type II secretory pathway)